MVAINFIHALHMYLSDSSVYVYCNNLCCHTRMWHDQILLNKIKPATCGYHGVQMFRQVGVKHGEFIDYYGCGYCFMNTANLDVGG